MYEFPFDPSPDETPVSTIDVICGPSLAHSLMERGYTLHTARSAGEAVRLHHAAAEGPEWQLLLSAAREGAPLIATLDGEWFEPSMVLASAHHYFAELHATLFHQLIDLELGWSPAVRNSFVSYWRIRFEAECELGLLGSGEAAR